MPAREITSGRAFERFIGFSDAVTAVAITLLALPLVTIAVPQNGESILTVLSDNSGAIWAFVITFVVVGIMWKSHARVFQSIRGYDQTLFVLNLAWLALIVLLPWPTSLYGQSGNAVHQGGDSLPGIGLFYWAVVATLSGLLSAMSVHAARTPGLHLDEAPTPLGASLIRGTAFGCACLIIGVVSVFAPLVAEWLPILLFPLGAITSRIQRRLNPAP